MPDKPYVTRIAPSPSGHFHIGTARTAYFNWLAARSTGGKFIVRIDDTNEALSEPRYVDLIYEALAWLGLDHDATFRQSDRLDRYAQVADLLLQNGLAKRVDGAVALANPVVFPDPWTDLVVGQVCVSSDDVKKCDGTVLVRSDGKPTYHFATVIDDHDYAVNLVLRGQDHVSNTLRQMAIYGAIGRIPGFGDGWDVPTHAHVGLIHQNRRKLSKRDGASSLLDYRDKGYDPDAMLNYLLRLGWGPFKDDKNAQYIPRDLALKWFLFEGAMRPASSNFDQAKLDWLDRKYKAMKKGM